MSKATLADKMKQCQQILDVSDMPSIAGYLLDYVGITEGTVQEFLACLDPEQLDHFYELCERFANPDDQDDQDDDQDDQDDDQEDE